MAKPRQEDTPGRETLIRAIENYRETVLPANDPNPDRSSIRSQREREAFTELLTVVDAVCHPELSTILPTDSRA
jgi:hypothetical protein